MLPFGFLIRLLRVHFRRGAVGNLVMELGGHAGPQVGLRDALARVLGDPSLQIFYRVSGTGGSEFVDDAGRPADLPGGNGGRSVTILDSDGAPIAALIHDPALEAEPELLESAAAAARLAIDNERLQAPTTRSPSCGVRSAASASWLAGFAILTHEGLGAALESLAARCPVPVEVRHHAARCTEAAEVTPYFVVAEGLANVAKHACATSTTVTVTQNGCGIRVEVADDGVGGVFTKTGSGLRGPEDRVAAIGLTFGIQSAPGQGTRLIAELPGDAG